MNSTSRDVGRFRNEAHRDWQLSSLKVAPRRTEFRTATDKEATMPDSTGEIAQRHGFSADAARAVADALRHGGGRMAQFNHPELGGMGARAAC
jgi:hypothetical protein